MTRKPWIDWLNVFAALSVVILHCNSYYYGPAQGEPWLFACLLQVLFYSAVPIFFMNVGATLMNYRDRMSTKEYFKRRASKTILPFVFWSFLFLLYSYFVQHKDVNWSIASVIDAILNAEYAHLYWFFPALYGCYLSIPVLSATNPRDKVLKYIVVLSFIFVSLLPLLCTLVGIRWNNELTPPVCGGYIIYLALGWLIASDSLFSSKRSRAILYALGIIGLITRFLSLYLLSLNAGEIKDVLSGYTNVPCILQSAAIYVFAKNLLENHFYQSKNWAKADNAIQHIARLTYGVYLTHWFITLICKHLLKVSGTSLIWQTAGALFVFCIALLLTWVIKKIPVLKNTIP